MSAVPTLQQWHQKCLQTVLRDVLWRGNRPRAENHCSKRREKPNICISPDGKLLKDTESRKYFYLHDPGFHQLGLQSAPSISQACAQCRTLSRYLYFNCERCVGREKENKSCPLNKDSTSPSWKSPLPARRRATRRLRSKNGYSTENSTTWRKGWFYSS